MGRGILNLADIGENNLANTTEKILSNSENFYLLSLR